MAHHDHIGSGVDAALEGEQRALAERLQRLVHVSCLLVAVGAGDAVSGEVL